MGVSGGLKMFRGPTRSEGAIGIPIKEACEALSALSKNSPKRINTIHGFTKRLKKEDKKAKAFMKELGL